MKHAHTLRELQRRPPKSWTLVLALRADRVERRLGRNLTSKEFARLDDAQTPDRLRLRKIWLDVGGWLEVRDGHIRISTERDPKRGRL